MKIGIFTAMEKEATSFLQNATEKIAVGSFDVYAMKLGKHDAYLCCPPSPGEFAASSACQLLISKFGVDVILNFGVVGSLTKEISLLSTVLVESVVHYGMDLSQIDNVPVGRYGCFDDVAVKCDEALLKKALEVENSPLVRCASADVFVGTSQQKTALCADFGAQICDMESAGVLFTCKFNNVPCLLIKCISDSLSGGHGEYRQNVLKATAGFFDFAKALASKL